MTRALLLLALALASCTAHVTVDETAPECTAERGDCAAKYGEGYACCAGRCVIDDPVDCDGEDE